ncbi:FAD-dependent monooxygenase [Deinococcus marmoris]|uniref:Salicylate hydroxylase n=1 Tax=Deinococcus marmoris TaxID=249408 RepID=A0A1U7NV69_9DEIO|nr:FAD-dependent monooxygenase [Deinococcus marmoris]OLV16814.1 Salicylate hydroxylase [Deinococcus marmoris]
MTTQTTEARPTEVLIAGAGPTGLLLALWLTRLGVQVRIVDPKPGPTTESRAIAVQARTLEFYDQLGLGKEALARGRHATGLRLWTRGRARAGVDLRGAGAGLTPHPDIFILPQDQNEALLLSHLTALGGAVEWQTRLTALTQDMGGVTATLERAGKTETVRAAYLAGCDGAGSAVRHSLGVSLSGGTYPQRFYVADVTARGPLSEDRVNVSLDDDQFLAFFPMPGTDHWRVVGQVPAGMGENVTFQDVRPQIDSQRIAQVSAVQWFSTYRVHHRVADQFQVGRTFLLGDAAHVHSPVGGQGMNTGLGDAANLAWKLAQTLRGAAPELLATYGPERRPFAVSLVNTTDRVFSGVVDPSPLARIVRTRLIPAVLGVLTRPAVVRRWAFGRLSQLLIHYPHSLLSAGRAGRVRGGDRLPWVPTERGSNFDALQSLGWQVHVYGTPSPDLLAWCAAREVPLHAFAFSRAAKRAGLLQDAFLLVRPDGYVGLAAAHFNSREADAYAARWLPPLKV